MITLVTAEIFSLKAVSLVFCSTSPASFVNIFRLYHQYHFLVFLTVYFIYRNFVVFEEKVQGHHLGKWKWISVVLMLLGMVSSVGAAMVANFQVRNILFLQRLSDKRCQYIAQIGLCYLNRTSATATVWNA